MDGAGATMPNARDLLSVPNDMEEQATLGTQRVAEQSSLLSVPASIPNGKQTDTDTTRPSGAEGGETVLQGNVVFAYCDGRCGFEWSYGSSMYCCKDCLDVQFEPNCHGKLLAITLERRVCSSAHNFLQVPSLDTERCRNTPGDQMRVDGRMIAKKDWMEAIKRRWLIDEDSLNLQEQESAAAEKIQKAWRKCRIERVVRDAVRAKH